MRNTDKRAVLRFIAICLISFIVFEAAEWVLLDIFSLEARGLELGWLATVVIYGLKTHILCCLLPMLWAAYKCRHRGCEHDHCKKDIGDEPES